MAVTSICKERINVCNRRPFKTNTAKSVVEICAALDVLTHSASHGKVFVERLV